MRRALTFLAVTGLSLASKHHSEHRKPTDATILKPFPEDNQPVQVSHGAFDDELFFNSEHRSNPYQPYINRPTPVSHGAFDDDNELRILFNPENPRPILQKSFPELNRPTQVSHGAFDDELSFVSEQRPNPFQPYINRPTQGSRVAYDDELSFASEQRSNPFQPYINRPTQGSRGAYDDELSFKPENRPFQPYINRPTQVSHGAFDDELHRRTEEPVLGGPAVKTTLENQKKFQHIQFPNPIVQEGKPVEVPRGAFDDELAFNPENRPYQPYINRPTQGSRGAFDDELAFKPENRPFQPYINRPTQVSHGAFDDELYRPTVKKTQEQEPVLGGRPSFRPYLENQKKFQNVQFPNPKVQEGKPVEVPYGAL